MRRRTFFGVLLGGVATGAAVTTATTDPVAIAPMRSRVITAVPLDASRIGRCVEERLEGDGKRRWSFDLIGLPGDSPIHLRAGDLVVADTRAFNGPLIEGRIHRLLTDAWGPNRWTVRVDVEEV